MSNYLRQGDIVTLNKDIPNKPVMMVYNIVKEQNTGNEGPFNTLIGIECIWFTESMEIQRAMFNFKDLETLEQFDYDA